MVLQDFFPFRAAAQKGRKSKHDGQNLSKMAQILPEIPNSGLRAIILAPKTYVVASDT